MSTWICFDYLTNVFVLLDSWLIFIPDSRSSRSLLPVRASNQEQLDLAAVAPELKKPLGWGGEMSRCSLWTSSERQGADAHRDRRGPTGGADAETRRGDDGKQTWSSNRCTTWMKSGLFTSVENEKHISFFIGCSRDEPSARKHVARGDPGPEASRSRPVTDRWRVQSDHGSRVINSGVCTTLYKLNGQTGADTHINLLLMKWRKDVGKRHGVSLGRR